MPLDYNASDTRSVRAAAKRAKIAESEHRSVIFNLMSSPAGRSYVYDFLLKCSVFHTPFTGVSSGTDFNCGRQSVGLELFGDIVRFTPDQYIQMMREASDKEQADGRRTDDNRSDWRSSNGGRDDSGSIADDADGSVISDYEPGSDGTADATG